MPCLEPHTPPSYLSQALELQTEIKRLAEANEDLAAKLERAKDRQNKIRMQADLDKATMNNT